MSKHSYVNQDTSYTPIEYIVFNDRSISEQDKKDFTMESLKFMCSLPRGPKKKVEYFNSKYGDYKIIKNLRGVYSWQQDNWCIYVSEKGFSFEVKKDLNSTQALDTWKDFLKKVGFVYEME